MDRYLLVQYIGEGRVNILDYDTWANSKLKLAKYDLNKKVNKNKEPITYNLELATNIDEAEEVIIYYKEGNTVKTLFYYGDDITIIKDWIISGELEKILPKDALLVSLTVDFPTECDTNSMFTIHNTISSNSMSYNKQEVTKLCTKAYEEAFHLAQSISPVKDVSKWLKENLT